MIDTRGFTIIVLFTLLVGVFPSEVGAIDLEGSSSRVTVRSGIDIDNDGMITLEFKVLWGESHFISSDIFIPRAFPPGLTWEDLQWGNLSRFIEPLTTIRYLFEGEVMGGRNLVHSPEFFVASVLDIDISFDILSIEQQILPEFETIEISAKIEPSENSYTLAPLSFLAKIDFHGYPPNAEIQLDTDPAIDIQTSSLALNHFLLPEGHRFKSEGLFGIESSHINYNIEKDTIKVTNLPPVISSTLLYSILVGAAFLSMIMVSVASRRAKQQVNKGFEMWLGIGLICFLAFFPYHLYISLILIALGFYRSVQKSKSLKPVSRKKPVLTDSSTPSTPASSTPPSEPDTTIFSPPSVEQAFPREDLRSLIPPQSPATMLSRGHPQNTSPGGMGDDDEEESHSPLFSNRPIPSSPRMSSPSSAPAETSVGSTPQGATGDPGNTNGSLPEDLQPRSILSKIGSDGK